MQNKNEEKGLPVPGLNVLDDANYGIFFVELWYEEPDESLKDFISVSKLLTEASATESLVLFDTIPRNWNRWDALVELRLSKEALRSAYAYRPTHPNYQPPHIVLRNPLTFHAGMILSVRKGKSFEYRPDTPYEALHCETGTKSEAKAEFKNETQTKVEADEKPLALLSAQNSKAVFGNIKALDNKTVAYLSIYDLSQLDTTNRYCHGLVDERMKAPFTIYTEVPSSCTQSPIDFETIRRYILTESLQSGSWSDSLVFQSNLFYRWQEKQGVVALQAILPRPVQNTKNTSVIRFKWFIPFSISDLLSCSYYLKSEPELKSGTNATIWHVDYNPAAFEECKLESNVHALPPDSRSEQLLTLLRSQEPQEKQEPQQPSSPSKSAASSAGFFSSANHQEEKPTLDNNRTNSQRGPGCHYPMFE